MVYSLDNKLLEKIYLQMNFIRNTELMIAKEYKNQEMRCPTHLSVGQEIVPAIYSLLVKKNDFAVSTHRGHAHYLAKKGNINKMIAEIYGKSSGCAKGKGGSMHLIDLNVNFMGTSAIVGNSIPLGVGLGLSLKLKKKKNISTIFFGEGATEEGVFYESLNFAALKNLPVLFICENNFYSVYSPLSVRQSQLRSNIKIANSLGIESKKIKNNNLSDYYNGLKDSFTYVREKGKPFYIELETYRWLEHCGPKNDDDLNYRDTKEVSKWLDNDPHDALKKYLISKDLFKNLNKSININNKKISDAFSYAKKSKPPSQKTTYDDIYSL